ncbi:DNA gyrase/topoisomerase IV subunit B [Alkaliphilus sp. B6464]|uniref:DNA gyrase/topoisomerase IV subunit B n=1 Tax=Alkaliphilus sp. B6464 TaxID=2731219 RepID=UPI001BAD373D|nr:DNA gyrase subunit B [Alkaliphilus sp. B6464]QUH22077.1 DNA gyrase subunit B [Alkaliphilus sp. B6464]
MINKYDGNSITVLEGLEPVRMNPGMYIGSTGSKGLHHLVEEIVANSVDESLAGGCTKIKVTINKDGSITIEDNGRGMPVEINNKTKLSAVRLIFEQLHAGGKFGQGGYKVSGGLHGVGAAVVNAFSEWLECIVYRNGKKYKIKYSNQKVVEDLKEFGNTNRTGTIITFKPDETMFTTTVFKYQTIKNRLKELAFLNRGLEFILKDERKNEQIEEIFKFDGGIEEYIKSINEGKNALHKDIIAFSGETEVEIIIKGKKEKRNIYIDIAVQYTDDYNENLYSFVNNISTIDGGTHLQGFKTAVTKTINDYCRREGILKDRDQNFTGNDTVEGITGIISVKLEYRPEFEGQTKAKLGNPEVRGAIQSYVNKNLEEYFAINKPTADLIINKVQQAARARDASKKARDVARKTSNPKQYLDKLADATSPNRSECEIYIVEGDSAGGSAKQARDRKTQGVLPLRGKSINVEKQSIEKILNNKEIQVMDAAFGVGVANECDAEKARYGKIIILTDADKDGEHIKNLLLTYLYRFKKPLIDLGKVYIGMPPLYHVTTNKNDYYIYTDKELEEFKIKLNKDEKIKHIQRYKGLGEMNPEQLKETCMNPKTRRIKKVYIEENTVAETLVTTFMGPKSELRMKYLQDNWVS